MNALKNDPQLFEAFMQGHGAGLYDAPPYLWSSSCFEAWFAGRHASAVGRPAPKAVKAGRGCSVRADGRTYRINYRADSIGCYVTEA